MKESVVILSFDEVSEAELLPWETRAKSLLGDVHPRRIREWALARLSLKRALMELGYELETTAGLQGHQLISTFPHLRYSLSHTDGFAGAWVRESKEGLGLDIELVDREVKPGIREKLLHPDDGEFSTLELWAGKEAAYKCLPEEIQNKIWLSRIALPEKGVFRVPEISGSWEVEKRGKLLVARARLH